MFNNLKQSAIAAIGALFFTITAVGAAVGPANSIEAAPAASSQAQIAGQTDA